MSRPSGSGEALTPQQARAVLLAARPPDDRHPLLATPLLVIDLDAGDRELDMLDEIGPTAVPLVVVGVRQASPLPRPPACCDLLLTTGDSEPAPWVRVPSDELDARLTQLAESVAASPQAATTLVQVLRAGGDLEVSQAVVLESWAYASLQGGAEHARYLARRQARAPAPAPDEERSVVLVERDEDLLRVTLDRPRARNAYNVQLRDELVAALSIAEVDPEVRHVELAGRGPAFCAGGDLTEFGTTPDPATAHLIRLTAGAARPLAALGPRLRARVHGACVGAGAEMAGFAARVVAAEDATFQLPELRMGLIPGAGGTASLPRRIGRCRTAWLALTGERIEAAQAWRWGLVDEVDASPAID